MRNRFRSVVFVACCVTLFAVTASAKEGDPEPTGPWTTWNLPASASPGGYVDMSTFLQPRSGTEPRAWPGTPIGFGPPPGDTFFYGGVEYEGIYVTTNGYAIPVNGGDPTSIVPFNQWLPDFTPPNNVIAPFWSDLDLKGTAVGDPGAGEMYAGTGNFLGGSTDYTVIEWHAVEAKGISGPKYTFQIWIELGTDNVWIVYGGLDAALPFSLTVGVEDATGSAGYTRHFSGTGEAPTQGVDLKVVYDASNILSHDFENGGLGGWSLVVQ